MENKCLSEVLMGHRVVGCKTDKQSISLRLDNGDEIIIMPFAEICVADETVDTWLEATIKTQVPLSME